MDRKTAGLLVALSVMAGVNTVYAADCKPLQKLVELPMTQLADGRVTVPATILDHQIALLVDTGTMFRSLTMKTAHDLKLRMVSGKIVMQDLQGHRTQEQTRVEHLLLGNMTVSGIDFAVIGKSDGDAQPGIDGSFTLDLVNDVDYDIDFGTHTFNIYSTDHCAGSENHGPAAVAVPFSRDNGGKIEFPVKVDDKEVLASLNTGLGYTTMNVNIARSRFDVDVKAADVQQVGQMGSRPVYVRRFKTLAIDKFSLANPAIILVPDLLGAPQPVTGNRALMDKHLTLSEMLLGMAMFKNLHLYISMKEDKLYFSPATESGTAVVR